MFVQQHLLHIICVPS